MVPPRRGRYAAAAPAAVAAAATRARRPGAGGAAGARRAARARPPRRARRRRARRPSVTAAITPRLRWMSSAIVSSIVSAASRYQAVTASCWPIRWQRSSAWSCIAGVHSSSRNATFDARVSVIPWPATRVAPISSCGPSGSWKACTAASRARRRVAARAGARRRGSARAAPPAPRRGGRRRRAARRTPGSRAIHVSAAASLPRAASRCSVPSCARRSRAQRRRDLRVELAQVQRLRAQPGDDVLLGEPVLASCSTARPARRPGAWPAAAAAPRTSGGARSSAGAGASAGAPPTARRGTCARTARPSRSPRGGR